MKGIVNGMDTDTARPASVGHETELSGNSGQASVGHEIEYSGNSGPASLGHETEHSGNSGLGPASVGISAHVLTLQQILIVIADVRYSHVVGRT